MTLPDNRPARKPRRLGLIIPWALAGVLVVAWSVGWFWLKGETERRMDAARMAAAQAGWRLDWTSRKVSGFPFRLNVDLKDARWGEASGWSITAPVLKAQAYVSAPTHWVMVAPAGLVLFRPHWGSVDITANALRASVSEFDQHPPRISVEAIGLRFDARNRFVPYWLIDAQEFHLHARSGPSDQAALYVEIDRGKLNPDYADPELVNVIFDVIYSHARALRGPDWPSSVRAWHTAGGQMTAKRILLQAGGVALLDAKSGDVTVNADGHLQGVLDGRGTPTTPIPFPGLY